MGEKPNFGFLIDDSKKMNKYSCIILNFLDMFSVSLVDRSAIFTARAMTSVMMRMHFIGQKCAGAVKSRLLQARFHSLDHVTMEKCDKLLIGSIQSCTTQFCVEAVDRQVDCPLFEGISHAIVRGRGSVAAFFTIENPKTKEAINYNLQL